MQNITTEQLAIAIHTAEKINELMKEKPHGAEQVAVHRYKLGLIFYRQNEGQIQAYYTDTTKDWQPSRSKTFKELNQSLNLASFILCNVDLLEKELSLHGYSDQPIPVLMRLHAELGVLIESADLRQENSKQNADYWNGYKAALESAQIVVDKLNE